MRRPASCIAVLLLLVWWLSPATAVEAPPPGLGIRLLEAPAERSADPRARSYVIDRVKPATSFTRRIEVSNGDPTPIDVLLYTAPATISDGGFAVQDRDDPGRIPDWVSVVPSRMRLAPSERAEAVVTVRVPADAPDGEFYGGVVAERPAPEGAGVGVVGRVAIRVYLSVGTGSEPASDFVVDSLTAKRNPEGQPVVEAEVRNTGGRALDMSGKLTLEDGPGGLSAGPFDVTLGTTLGIREEQPVTVVLDPALPAGPWRAVLRLRSGELERGVEGIITFPDQAGEAADPVAAQPLPLAQDLNVLIPIAASLILLIILGLLWWLIARRRNKEKKEREAPEPVPAG